MTGLSRLTHPVRNDRGAVLFAAVAALLLLSTLLVGLMVLGRDEGLIAVGERQTAQAAYGAEAGANHGRWMLAQRIRQDLAREVRALGRPAMIVRLNGSYGTPAGAALMLAEMAIPASTGPGFVLCSTVAGGCPEPNFSSVGNIADTQQAVLTVTSTDPAYTTRVVVGAHPTIPPVVTNGGTGAVFTYVWRVEASGTSGQALQQFVIHDSAVPANTAGSFTIGLNSSFVLYAHFIDSMDDTQAWISYRHVYTGPVHTNTRFNILGNPGGPTFRSAATQWDPQVRFNNGGSAVLRTRDSTTNDQPLLGPAPGILCNAVDCSGFTRTFDYDPDTVAIDKIPFPTAGSGERDAQITMAQGPNYATNLAECTAGPCPVIVAHSPALALNGGVYVNGRVLDLELGATGNGQLVILETTASNAGVPAGGQSRRRTVLTEFRNAAGPIPAGTMVVERQCWGVPGPAPPAECRQIGGTGWIADVSIMPASARTKNLIAPSSLFSPNASTDRGMIFVDSTCINNSCGTGLGAIGERNTTNGLRKLPLSTDPTRAIDQNTRLTVAADGDIYITGHLNYQVEPRGPDLAFSDPIPGAGDDVLDTQNVLGVVSWDGGIHLSEALNQTMLNNTLPVGDLHRDGHLRMNGMFMSTNISGGTTTGEGQVAFDDPSGTYRGEAQLLGGVVQKTMGTFGSPGSPGTGYARDWVYDERFRHRGLSPPAFPGFPDFATTAGIGVDSYTWRLGRFNF